MVFILGNLPDRTKEKDIKELFNHSNTLTEVTFFKSSKICCHSEYECMITLNFISRFAGLTMQNKLHGYCWKGRCIHSQMMIFSKD